MIKKFRFVVLNNSHKVKFSEYGCSLRELDQKLAKFISSHGGAYRCEVEYKWRFCVVTYYDNGYIDYSYYPFREYDEIFLIDYRVLDIDI